MISAYDSPHRFVDEQTSGPFSRWWHEHRFESVPEGTRMADIVEYSSPMGGIGTIALDSV
jgi:ligand-binding SRPBCC domain-containing protein